jgi:hypothetical protein
MLKYFKIFLHEHIILNLRDSQSIHVWIVLDVTKLFCKSLSACAAYFAVRRRIRRGVRLGGFAQGEGIILKVE